MASATRKPRASQQVEQIEFDFIKSNFFRVIKADGAFGGLTPSGSIHMALYSERQPIPTKVIHKLEGGQLGPEIRERREGRQALVREVEVDVVLDPQQAISLRDWLTDKIKQYQQASGKVEVAKK